MFNLYQLGWHSFQELCLTIAREVFGQTTMSFLESGDGGRDGSFSGNWQATEKLIYEGFFVIQCKFSNKVNKNLRISDLKEELPKAKGLAQKRLCDIYILMTNMGVSGTMDEKIQILLKAEGVKHVLIFGLTWLCQQIRDNKRLRIQVPRVYGLGDLSQILDERVYEQGQKLLAYLKDELSKVVVTEAYRKAAQALDAHGFVLLIGEPAAGKTTIASLLAMGAMDQWKTRAVKLQTATQVIQHWNPNDPSTFYWIDDAFGVTQYELNLSLDWNHQFGQIKVMLEQGIKVVMTSRDYIYNRARKDLKESAFPLLKESQVVIDVMQLSLSEKKQILYNHIKLGKQTKGFRKAIKPFLEDIALLPTFVPETARRIADPLFTKGIAESLFKEDTYLTKWRLNEFVNKQEGFLVDLISKLDKHNQAALALIYMNADNLPSPIKLQAHETKSIERLESSEGKCIAALENMKGNLVQFVYSDDESFWKFKHPTIGDAFAIFVTQSAEFIDIYLHGSSVEKLIQQITCGDVKMEKAIIVTKPFFPLIMQRLKKFTASKAYKSEFLQEWGAKRTLHNFLTYRCSEEFLSQYIEVNPEILPQVVKPTSTSNYASEIPLAHRLFRLNLLPEDERLTLVETLSQSAVSGKDLYILKSEEIKEMFKEDEFTNLRLRIELELVPIISELTKDKENKFSNRYRPSEEANEYMETLMDAYETLEQEFQENSQVLMPVRNEIKKVKIWIAKNTVNRAKMPKREKLAGNEILPAGDEERSVFDDIDK